MSYNSVSVYYFYYYILKLYLPPPRGVESPWMTASHWRQKQLCSAPLIISRIWYDTICANRAQLATAWITGDTCTVCGHPTISNYFTMYFYKIVVVAVVAFIYHSSYHCQPTILVTTNWEYMCTVCGNPTTTRWEYTVLL